MNISPVPATRNLLTHELYLITASDELIEPSLLGNNSQPRLSGTGTKPGSGKSFQTITEKKPGIPIFLNQLPKPEPRTKPGT